MMRSTNFQLFLSTLFLIALFACNRNSNKQEILTEKIQYDVPVINGDPQLDWWVNNIEGSKREPFLKRIMEAAEKGEVRVFDYFNHPLTPQQLPAQCIDTIYRTLVRSYPPYEEYDTMTINAVSYKDITKIRFLEEWTWEPGSVNIEKKVIAIGPVVQREIAGESFNQLLFWIYLDDRYPAR
jgi:hypothetical protein